MERLDGLISRKELPEEVCKGFSEGKMLGVLVCEEGCLAAFSGSVGGRSTVDSFVPPIYDLLEPSGYFKEREAEISLLNNQIRQLTDCPEVNELRKELAEAERDRDEETGLMRAAMSAAKKEREMIRNSGCCPDVIEGLVRQSQFEKAEFRRLRISWEGRISDIRSRLDDFESRISGLKVQRSAMSDELQEWIFRQYRVMNGLGEESSILEIFAAEGLVPPGGTGDCAAPKLLDYAFRHGLKPVAMGEFWYGKSPDTAVRTHGHFYPSCTSKCGPLLKYMLKGLTLSTDAEPAGTTETGPDDRPYRPQHSSDGKKSPILDVIYEDETIIVVDKPSGMPSVPGMDGRESTREWLQKRALGTHEVHTVHRLDMDTSGLLLFAKTGEAAVNLRKQFEERTVKKTYRALLCPPAETRPDNMHPDSVSTCKGRSDSGAALSEGDHGTIDLPLAPDYDERPRQKVDLIQGKPAITEYEVLRVNPDGTTEVLFHPVTGRTHQLRVHSAHHLGLGRPIVGDLLYGAHTIVSPLWVPGRLCLHAAQISFIHPATGRNITLTTQT